MKNKSLLKKLLIGGGIGLGVGFYIFFCAYLYGYLASLSTLNMIINILVIPGLILLKISSPVLGFFSYDSQSFQSIVLIICWIFLGILGGLIIGFISKIKSSER